MVLTVLSAFTIDFGQLKQSFEILNEFYLTLNYHTDDVPDKKIKLPSIGQMPKLEKVVFKVADCNMDHIIWTMLY